MQLFRLETLGDAFLKYVISVELYKIRSDMREGQLTSARAAYINNRKQCQVCLSTGMSKYMRVIALSRGERLVTVCPPGMPTADHLPLRSIWGTDIMATPAERKYRVEAMYRFPKLQHQRRTVLFKKLADMVEAVIAAYYIDCGEAAGIAAVKAFCCWPRNAIPATNAATVNPSVQPPPPVPVSASAGAKASHAALMAAYNNRFPQTAAFQPPRAPGSSPSGGRGKHFSGRDQAHNTTTFHARYGSQPGLYASPPESSPNRKRPYASNFSPIPLQPLSRPGSPGFVPPPPSTPPPQPPRKADLSDLEASLGYTFKDRGLLRLALTHASLSRCNNAERLEFLGDAVLDFVTVSYWFKHNVAFEPVDLHEAKSRNTCNRNLASKAYTLGLHKFLQYNSEHLQAQLEAYCAEHFARDQLPEPAAPTTPDRRKAPFSGPLGSVGLSAEATTSKKEGEAAISTSDVLADTLEAVIGAIFLDCGEDTRVIEKFAAENNLLVA
jgi:dsRNA-specific ribonuclease